jgi:predicted transcriptional regulator
MSKEDIEKMLRESGRGMTLDELAEATGLSKGTVQQNVNALWNEHSVSRMYRFDDSNVRFVYYYYGGRLPGDNGGMAKWPRKKATLTVGRG